MTVTHTTAWDTSRDLARLLVHMTLVAQGTLPNHPPTSDHACLWCEEAIEWAPVLAEAIASWDRSHHR